MISQVSTGASEPSPSNGVLVLAATPIGRVADAPPRLAEELAAADVVAPRTPAASSGCAASSG